MASVFSRIIQGTLPGYIVWQDARFVALLDIHPINPGHTLLVPREEIDSIYDLPGQDYTDLWRHARGLAQAIRRATGAARVGIAVEGFEIPHAHVHLVPLNRGNELDPNRARSASAAELSAMQDKIRREIASSDLG